MIIEILSYLHSERVLKCDVSVTLAAYLVKGLCFRLFFFNSLSFDAQCWDLLEHILKANPDRILTCKLLLK